MDFVADESCAAAVIRALRQVGHDVVAIAKVAKGATDEQVLERALTEKRVLVRKTMISANWCIADAPPRG